MGGAETGAIMVDRSRDKVWRQLTTLDGLVDWYDDWDTCAHDPADQLLREGVVFRLRSARTRAAECRVVTVDEPRLLRWIERRAMRAPVLVEFRLEAAADDSTIVTHSKTTGRLRRVG